MKPFYTRFIAVLTLCFLISLNVKAQETALTTNHLKAAEEMLVSMNMPNLFATTINNVVKAQSAALPQDKQKLYATVMNTFMNKYLNWDFLKIDMAKIYASEFSESELKELTTFYQTPLGKKMLEKSPALMQKGMLVGQQLIVSHQAELQEMIKAASSKN